MSEIREVLRKFSPISPSGLKALSVVLHLHRPLNLTAVIAGFGTLLPMSREDKHRFEKVRCTRWGQSRIRTGAGIFVATPPLLYLPIIKQESTRKDS